jgi:transposase
MSSPALAPAALPPEWAAERAAWATERAALHEHIARLEQRIAWFERQLFGEKSERRHLAPPPEQLSLGAGLGDPAAGATATQTVAAHQRRPATKTKADGECQWPWELSH